MRKIVMAATVSTALIVVLPGAMAAVAAACTNTGSNSGVPSSIVSSGTNPDSVNVDMTRSAAPIDSLNTSSASSGTPGSTLWHGTRSGGCNHSTPPVTPPVTPPTTPPVVAPTTPPAVAPVV